MIVVLAGVSGVGKTTVGRLLAERLGCEFRDGDDFHSTANIEKMRAGAPLDDSDRKDWLAAIRAEIETLLRAGRTAVFACSALKKSYRELLAVDSRVRFVILASDFDLISRRIANRQGHFMPAELLASQFETLEIAKGDRVIDASGDAEQIASEIIETLPRVG